MTVTAFLPNGDRIHGPECKLSGPPRPSVHNGNKGGKFGDCDCVRCLCFEHLPGGGAGACRRCHRPLVVDGKVVRLTREQVTA